MKSFFTKKIHDVELFGNPWVLLAVYALIGANLVISSVGYALEGNSAASGAYIVALVWCSMTYLFVWLDGKTTKSLISINKEIMDGWSKAGALAQEATEVLKKTSDYTTFLEERMERKYGEKAFDLYDEFNKTLSTSKVEGKLE